MVVIVIIAALMYGSSFFWGKNTKETKESTNFTNVNSPAGAIEALDQAKEDIVNINKQTEERDEVIAEILNDNPAEEVSDSIADWQTVEREEFMIKYPNGWFYTVNHKAAQAEGNELIAGFASSSSIWEQEPPYDINLTVREGKFLYELDNTGKFFTAVGDNITIILSTDHDEYKDILKQMYKTLEFIE